MNPSYKKDTSLDPKSVMLVNSSHEKNSTKIILRLARQAWLQTKYVPCNPFPFTKVGLISFHFAHFSWWFRLFYEMHVTTRCWSINSHNCALGGMVTLTCCTSYINKLVHSLNTTYRFFFFDQVTSVFELQWLY